MSKTTLKINSDINKDLMIYSILEQENKELFTEKLLKLGLESYRNKYQKFSESHLPK